MNVASILISIERLGPIGVVELAERAGRDYTTVSRQVAKLEKLGLIIRQHNAIDRRIREAVISRTGKAMTERIDAAREQMGKVVFKDWPQDELDVFVDGIIFTLSNTNDSYRDNFIFDAVDQSVSCTTQLNFVLVRDYKRIARGSDKIW